VRMPVIEMVEIGAGGGSIARVDALKRITVGPDSAASVPGPACYGRGGTLPTVTDADVVMGKIEPAHFAGGAIALFPEKAAAALDEGVGEMLALSIDMAAHGVGEIVDENMANAARVHAVERGVAIRDHTMVAFGGAAPLHAARLAEKLGIRRVIVPADAGVGSAIGFLCAPAAYELVHARFMRLDRFELKEMNDLLAAMSREATGLAKAAAGRRRLEETRTAFMRYAGQGHEIAVPLPARQLAEKDIAAMRERFEAGYRRLFARHIPGAAIEVLSWAVLVTTGTAKPQRLGKPRGKGAPRPIGTRPVFDARSGRAVKVPMYDRLAMAPGTRLKGPAIVVEAGTSTLVSAAFDAEIDAGLGLVLTQKGKRRDQTPRVGAGIETPRRGEGSGLLRRKGKRTS
jgi:N-methylhydantoinase A